MSLVPSMRRRTSSPACRTWLMRLTPFAGGLAGEALVADLRRLAALLEQRFEPRRVSLLGAVRIVADPVRDAVAEGHVGGLGLDGGRRREESEEGAGRRSVRRRLMAPSPSAWTAALRGRARPAPEPAPVAGDDRALGGRRRGLHGRPPHRPAMAVELGDRPAARRGVAVEHPDPAPRAPARSSGRASPPVRRAPASTMSHGFRCGSGRPPHGTRRRRSGSRRGARRRGWRSGPG